MNGSLRFFFIIEAIFLVAAFGQIYLNDGFPMVIIGLLCCFFAVRRDLSKLRIQLFLFAGILMIFMTLLSSPAFWCFIVIGILFIGLKGTEIAGVPLISRFSWRNQEMKIVKTKSPGLKYNKKNSWFGNQKLGSEIYEWDDININVIAGDTIIDLGNTLLPKDDSVVIVRKGFGRTRILVPLGVEVMLNHSTFSGNVLFNSRKYQLGSEQVTLYTDDYDTSNRRLKIITNSLIGDVEVIQI